MATKEEIKHLEKKYGIKIIYYPKWLINIMDKLGKSGATICLNKKMIMYRNYVEGASEEYLESTFVHEKVHETRIPDDILGLFWWYLKYIFSREFRFKEEAYAYATEIIFENEGNHWKHYERDISWKAQIMAGSTYKFFGPMCDKHDAEVFLTKIVKRRKNTIQDYSKVKWP